MPALLPPPLLVIEPPRPGGLGERLINGMLFLLKHAWDDVIVPGIHLFAPFTKLDWATFTRPVGDAVPDAVRGLGGDDELVGIVRGLIQPIQSLPTFVGLVFLVPILTFGGVTILTDVIKVSTKRSLAQLNYKISSLSPTFRISAEDGVMAERRNALDPAVLRNDLRELGVDEMRAEALIARSYRWLTPSQIEEIKYRNILPEPELLQMLRGSGLTDTQAAALWLTFDRLPSASDLQRFGIREVFTPALREALRFPEPGVRYYEEMAKLGFSQERAEWFWMAHWRLPSLTQGYDMFRRYGPHRGRNLTFSEDDLRELMRRDDMLSKYWDLLIAVQYRPPNRLDIWRLATSNRIDRPTAREWYMDYGYSPELAETMADIATDDRTREGRDLTRSLVTQAYKRRQYSRDQAAAALTELGFFPDDVELLLTLADLERQSERAGERTSVTRQRYLAGLISREQASGQLAALGKPTDEIGDLLELWDAQFADKVQVPAVGSLETWYKRRIISGPQAREELRRRGYEDRYVEWWLLEWDQEIQEAEERLTEAELRARQTVLKIPTRADLQAWVKAGIITLQQFAERLAAQGYSADDVANYARLVGLDVAPPAYQTDVGKQQVATLRQAIRRDLITLDDLQTGLQNLGMSPELAAAITDYEAVRAA